MEINVKEARSKMSLLLDKAQKGEDVVIMRRGQRIARLVPVGTVDKRLPDLSAFRSSISIHGGPMSRAVIQERSEERY